MLLGTLGGSLIGNILTDRGLNRAGKGRGINRAGEGIVTILVTYNCTSPFN